MKREKSKGLKSVAEELEKLEYKVVEARTEDRKRKDVELLAELAQNEEEELQSAQWNVDEPLVQAELKHRGGFRMRIEILVPEGTRRDQKFSLGDMREAFEQLCLVAGQDDFAGALLQQVDSDVEIRLK